MKSIKKSKAKAMWKNLMNSTQKKFSRGASNISKIITWPRLDNWRRRQKIKKPGTENRD